MHGVYVHSHGVIFYVCQFIFNINIVGTPDQQLISETICKLLS